MRRTKRLTFGITVLVALTLTAPTWAVEDPHLGISLGSERASAAIRLKRAGLRVASENSERLIIGGERRGVKTILTGSSCSNRAVWKVTTLEAKPRPRSRTVENAISPYRAWIRSKAPRGFAIGERRGPDSVSYQIANGRVSYASLIHIKEAELVILTVAADPGLCKATN